MYAAIMTSIRGGQEDDKRKFSKFGKIIKSEFVAFLFYCSFALKYKHILSASSIGQPSSDWAGRYNQSQTSVKALSRQIVLVT